MSRKDLLDDLSANNTITITTSTGRRFYARTRELLALDLEMHPPIERLSLQLGSIVSAPVPTPSRASIERLLLDTYPTLASAPPRLRAHLARHAEAIATLVDAASEAPAEAGIVPLTGERSAC